MNSLSNSSVLPKNQPSQLLYGSSVKSIDHGFSKLSFGQSRVGSRQLHTSKRTLSIQAGYSGDSGSSSGGAFVGGFVLGGLIVGTLGFVYAPKIGKALAGADKKDLLNKLPTFVYDEEKAKEIGRALTKADKKQLLKKLPNFIYDEEKALEKTRKKLADKITQLNSAIDDVSFQLQSDDDYDNYDDSKVNTAVVPEEAEAIA